MKKNILFFLLTITTAYSNLYAQDFLRAENKDIVDESGNVVILRGMGLGGWMVQEGYMLQTAEFAGPQHKIKAKILEVIGDEATEEFYESWLANHVRKIDIDSLKAWGFNSVRLPMHYNLYTLPIEDEPITGENTWLEKGFTITDSLISWCKANEMHVILDLHAAPGGQGYDEAISDYDPDKPSLWESATNQNKTVELWRKLSQRYKDEPTVAGYDLLNEVNWDLPGGTQLRSLYEQITSAIRNEGDDHIIFIEGNWFANDFTGLTPPWDDNLVYSPHKYWSTNDQASIQWVLDLRDQHNVPLYLGESGENSNAWFRDAIELLENEGIGWAWWPMKKIESVVGPLSVNKNFGYEALLNYWKGNGAQPNQATATAALMGIATSFQLENCIFERGVIDAMFRQVQSSETLPYKEHSIPGKIHCADYDLGTNNEAYFDIDAGTYHVSTGTFTAWNNGWIYRNDGVDLEQTQDSENELGIHIGWTNPGEWTKYTAEIQEAGVYDVLVRVAVGGFGSKLHFSSGGADINKPHDLISTGGYQNFETQVISDVILSPEHNDITLHIDGAGFNISSFEFVKTGESEDIETQFVSGITETSQQVKLYLNKALDTDSPVNLSDFAMLIGSSAATITNAMIDVNDSRIIYLDVEEEMKFNEVIKASYFGTSIQAEDGTPLLGFAQKILVNNLPSFFIIPGRIEAEEFFAHEGIELESASDIGGGQNIGYLDVGDYADYDVFVETTGIYSISYRNASDGHSGGLTMQLIDSEGMIQNIQTVVFESSGGWQEWQTTSFEANVPSGRYTLRLLITKNQFNLNWFDFNIISSSSDTDIAKINFTISPNPTISNITITGNLKTAQNVDLQLLNMNGTIIKQQSYFSAEHISKEMNLDGISSGIYLIKMITGDGSQSVRKVIIY
ncbi:cellulase family glycosylhydrolase [Saprospiraceae bacterium]|nr:cellulase family glycosylhydrolase [Saprospiraceae bacterium]